MQITINDPTPKTAQDIADAYNAGLAAGNMVPFFYIENFCPGWQLFFKDANGQNVAPVVSGIRYKDADWPQGSTHVDITNPPAGYVLDSTLLFTNGTPCVIWPASFTSNGPAALGTPTSIVKATPVIQIYNARQLQ